MQLFTHLLSSYLQGMEDFFSALPRGESANQLYTNDFTLLPIPLTRAEIGFIGVLISYGNTEPKVTGVMLCVAER